MFLVLETGQIVRYTGTSLYANQNFNSSSNAGPQTSEIIRVQKGR